MVQLPRQLSFHKILYTPTDDCYQSSFVSISSKNNTYIYIVPTESESSGATYEMDVRISHDCSITINERTITFQNKNIFFFVQREI